MPKKITKLEDLTPDPHNANRGTERGRALLIEIDALLNGDADGANPPPPMDTPA
jgi:hypothetical protein